MKTLLIADFDLPVSDALAAKRRKKRAKTAAWRKRARKLKQTAAGKIMYFDSSLQLNFH
jgi:hypothetical protein